MKATNKFQETILNHLKELADKDPLFAETFAKPNKNIADCEKYILNEVHKSGCNGFADEEIYQMAVHYYDEDTIDVGKSLNAKVVINQSMPKPVKTEPIKVEAKPVKKPSKQTVPAAQASIF
jgi:hypothetical protein